MCVHQLWGSGRLCIKGVHKVKLGEGEWPPPELFAQFPKGKLGEREIIWDPPGGDIILDALHGSLPGRGTVIQVNEEGWVRAWTDHREYEYDLTFWLYPGAKIRLEDPLRWSQWRFHKGPEPVLGRVPVTKTFF